MGGTREAKEPNWGQRRRKDEGSLGGEGPGKRIRVREGTWGDERARRGRAKEGQKGDGEVERERQRGRGGEKGRRRKGWTQKGQARDRDLQGKVGRIRTW